LYAEEISVSASLFYIAFYRGTEKQGVTNVLMSQKSFAKGSPLARLDRNESYTIYMVYVVYKNVGSVANLL
jgi:hypothetical protein